LQPTARADAQLGHAANPGGLAANVVDFAPFAGAEQFERQEGGVHWTFSQRPVIEIESQYSLAEISTVSILFSQKRRKSPDSLGYSGLTAGRGCAGGSQDLVTAGRFGELTNAGKEADGKSGKPGG
jgi:hypothetical protein